MAAEAWLRNFMRNDGEVVSLKEALRRLDEVRGNGNEKAFRSTAYCCLLPVYLLSISICLSVYLYVFSLNESLFYLILSYLIPPPPTHTHTTPQAIRLPDGLERGYVKEINDVDIGDLLYYHLQSVRVAHDELDEYVFEILRKVVVSLVWSGLVSIVISLGAVRQQFSAVLRQVQSVSQSGR